MIRRDFLKAFGAGAATFALRQNFLHAAETKHKKHKNVLLYVVDDQGSTDAGCYGNKIIKTPGLDLLAKNGTRFTNGFCTTASCSPSRAVILTGKHNHATGMYGLNHRIHHFTSFDSVKSLPNLLGKEGYETISVGKYHVGPENIYHFDKYLKTHAPLTMADECKEAILESDKSNKPFFIYFCTHEPHRPFTRIGSDKINPNDVTIPSFLPDTKEVREELAEYYMSVQRGDSGLLKMIEILKQTGHWDDTLIIYVSDNGMAFPGAKTTLYEPGMKLPCVVRDPNQSTKNVVCDGMVNWTDITPSILDYAGIKYDSSEFHGRSFIPILSEKKPKEWDEVYGSHTFHEVTMYYPMRVIRQRQYKLIWNLAYPLEFPTANDLWKSKTWQSALKRKDKKFGKRDLDSFLQRPEFELYDIKKDPDEINNLANNPKYAKVLKKLKEKLKKFQKETEDPWIVNWKRKAGNNNDSIPI